MSTPGSQYEVDSVIGAGDAGQDTVPQEFEQAFYSTSLAISESYAFDFPGQYVTEESAVTHFVPLPDHYFSPPPEPERIAHHSPEIPCCTVEGFELVTFAPIDTSVAAPVPPRPHSSPSSFRLNQEEFEWPAEPQPPSSRPEDPESPASVLQPTEPITPVQPPSRRQASSVSSIVEFHSPHQPRRYTPIAPNPAGLRQLQAQKRAASDDPEWEIPGAKRKKSAPPSPNFEVTEEDSFLLRLKDQEQLTWKEIALRFQNEMGKSYQIPALQMRLKRLRERLRVWTEVDVHALKLAYDYWQNQKFEIIAAKMSDYGSQEKWSPRQVSRKWQEISYGSDALYNPMMWTPTFSTSYTSSPVEGPAQGFLPPFPIVTTASFQEPTRPESTA